MKWPGIGISPMFSRGEYDVDAQLYFNQVITNGGASLSASTKSRINRWVLAEKESGNFSKRVRFHFLFNDNLIAARTSIVNPSQAMITLHGTAAWTQNSGIQILATGDYVNTKFNASTDASGLYTLNSAGHGFGVFNNKDGAFIDIGGTDTVQKSYMFSAFSGVNYSTVNNAAAGGDTTFANTTLIDDNYHSIRTANNVLIGYKGNTSTSGAGASLGLPNAEQYLGAYNSNGSVTLEKIGASYSWFSFFSGALDVAAANSAIDEYLNQTTVTAFGHSILRGNNGTVDLPINFLTQLCASRGYKQDNRAVSSTCLQSVAPVNPAGASPNLYDNMSAIPAYNTNRRLVIMYIINDTGFNFTNYTVANFGTQLGEILDYAIGTKGWDASKIYFVDGALVDPTKWSDYDVYGPGNGYATADETRYRNMVAEAEDVCAEKGANFINLEDAFTNNGGLALLQDGRHFNQTGNNIAAAELIASSI